MLEHLPEAGASLPTPKAREVFFTKQVTQDTISELSQKILEINRNDAYLTKLYALHGVDYIPRPIRLYIDSYGGSVYQCFGLLGIMENSKTPIDTIVIGVAMSAGFMIAIHGHKRFAYKHATLMYHQLSSMSWGKMADLEQDLEESKRLHKKMLEQTIKHTHITLRTLEDNYERKVDWYMPAEEALANGCIDEII